MSYLVYYDENGEISGTVSGPADFIQEAIEAYEGLTVLSDFKPELSHWVKDGVIVSRGDRPSPAYEFNYQAEEWQHQLAEGQAIRWQAIKDARDNEEFGTFEWNEHIFQCDEVSQRRIQGAVQLAAIDSSMTLDWTLADDTVETFTAADYVGIGQALANHVSQCHERGRILRQQINAATTEEELEAIVW